MRIADPGCRSLARTTAPEIVSDKAPNAKAVFQSGAVSIASKWAERETVGTLTRGDRLQLSEFWGCVHESHVFRC